MKVADPEQALVSVKKEFGEHGGLVPSVERSSTFTVMGSQTMSEIFSGEKGPDTGGCFLYSRSFNPTVQVLSRSLAAMEGTEAAICTASGMSAISCTLMQICKHGDHIVASNAIYGGTHAFLNSLLPEVNINTTFVDITDLAAVEAAIKPNTKVIYTEAIGNPTLCVADIKALSAISIKNNLKLVVDNTFSPMILTPGNFGADVIVYSMTKYINGASDLIAGAICADKQFIGDLMDLHTGRVMLLGPTIDPRVAFDIQQRLPHLALRMREHGIRALAMAKMLKELGVKVNYPGLEDHPQFELATRTINEGYGCGGIFTIDCESSKKANELMDSLQNDEDFGYLAVSLGSSDTLMSCSSTSTSSELSEEEQNEAGLSPGLVRLSAGITGALEDRMAQLKRSVSNVLLS
jgi:methionine-gamma-lyase